MITEVCSLAVLQAVDYKTGGFFLIEISVLKIFYLTMHIAEKSMQVDGETTIQTVASVDKIERENMVMNDIKLKEELESIMDVDGQDKHEIMQLNRGLRPTP